MARNIHWTSLYFPSSERYISELEILNDKLEVQLKTDLKKEIYTQNKIKEKEILIVEYLSKLRQLKEEVLTPESDVYVTPELSPTDVRRSFGHSRCASLHCPNTLYYSLVTVDEVYSCESADILEKELAEQDQLFKSFKSIISRDSKSSKNDVKPFTLAPPFQKSQYCLNYSTSGKNCKKNKFFDIKLCMNSNFKDRCSIKNTENNSKLIKNVVTVSDSERVLSYKLLQEGMNETAFGVDGARPGVFSGPAHSEHVAMSKVKVDNEDVETENNWPDSCLEAASSGYLTGTGTSPRDRTTSASESNAFGGDLTEVATSEDIPHDNDQSARSSSMSSDAGTWDSTFLPNTETTAKEQTAYDNIKTVVEHSDHGSNMSVTRYENVCSESCGAFDQDKSNQLEEPIQKHVTNNLQTETQINFSNNKYREYSSDICVSAHADINIPLNKSASASHAFSHSNGEIQINNKENKMFPGKNNFFINAANLLDENEMSSVHPNSLNYSNELLEGSSYSSSSKIINEKSNSVEIGDQPQIVAGYTIESDSKHLDRTPTDQGDLENRRSSLIRRNTFELELDDERLAALRKECERHKVQQSSCNATHINNCDQVSTKDRNCVPSSLPGLICTSGFIQKCDDEMHSPDSLNNDGPGGGGHPCEKDNTSHSMPFEVNTATIDTRERTDIIQDRNKISSGGFMFDSYEINCDSNMSGEFTSKNNIHKNNPHKSDNFESLPILSGGVSFKDISSLEIVSSSPIMNRRKTEFAPILSGGSVTEVEPTIKPKIKQNSVISSSWIVDMSETSKSPPEENNLSSTDVDEVKIDDSQKPTKSNNSSLGFFVPLDDPLEEKSGDSGYKSGSLISNKDAESLKSVSRGDAMSSVTNLSNCSSSCGFYVDLKDTPVIAEKSVDKDTSTPDKKLFSMFIDIGDSGGNEGTKSKTISPHLFKRRSNRSHSGLQSLRRDEKSRFSDSQMSSESSLELTDSPELSKEKKCIDKEIGIRQATTVVDSSSSSKTEDKSKKQGFYMFIESEQSPVPLRKNLPTGLLPASQRHSWNSESQNLNSSVDGSGCQSVPKRVHRRSHSVSVNKSLDVMFNVEENENKSSSVSPLVKVSTSNSTGYESGPSSMDDTVSKSCTKSMMSSWHGSVRPSIELQKVIARNDGKERREIKSIFNTNKSPLDSKSGVVNEVLESLDKSDEFTYASSKGEDLSITSNESSNTGKHGNSTFIVSDVSNVANASSNDLEITTPTCDVVSQLSKDDSDKTEIDFDDVGDKKSVDLPRTPDHSITQVDIPVTTEHKFNFVKLSDMDKEPKSIPVEDKICVNRMSRSIPEASWIESKMMTRSATSRSLSRLFPHLNTSARNGTPDSGDHDTDFSEISSMQSSMDPSALEGSTEETDASSCANGPVSRLGEDLLRMFLDEISPDVTVEVGGRRIKAHKCILSSRCQYFAAILSGGWVESAGNVISLQGFSYSAVHFALCHIYSGASNIPDSINIVELATLADMLCLEGLKEVIMYTLKVKYCHFFHKPCPMCTVGVLECLPLAAAYGLDEIYRKSLRWITKYFVRVWPTKGFAALPRELFDKCYKQHIVHMTVDNVLETVMCCGKLQGLIPNVRWAEPVFALTTKLHEAAVKFIAQHFSEILSSDGFMSLGKEQLWTMNQLEETLLSAAEKLPPDQACKCHSHLYKLISVINTPESSLVVKWNDGFVEFLNLLSSTVEHCLLKQAARASRTPAWTLMEPQLRHKIQDAACLVIVPGDDRRRARHLLKRGDASNVGKRSTDLLQSKSALSDLTTTKKSSVPARPNVTVPAKPKSSQVTNANKTENTGPRPKTWPHKISEVKSRYLEPKATPKQSPAPANANRPEKSTPTARRNVSKSIISSSDSSRTSSPAMKRSVPQRTSRSLPNKESKKEDNLTMSIDSLAEPGTTGAKKKADVSKTHQLSRTDFVEKNMRSLSVKSGSVKVASSEISARVNLSEVKGKPATISKAEDKPKYSPIPLSKRSSCQSSPRIKDSPIPQVKSTVNSTPSPSARQNTLSPKEKSHVTADTKSTLLKRNATYRVQAAKPSSPTKGSSGKLKDPIGTSPSFKGNINKIQSKVSSSKKSVVNNNILTSNRKTETKPQPMVGSRSGTFLKDEPTVLKKPEVVNVSE